MNLPRYPTRSPVITCCRTSARFRIPSLKPSPPSSLHLPNTAVDEPARGRSSQDVQLQCGRNTLSLDQSLGVVFRLPLSFTIGPDDGPSEASLAAMSGLHETVISAGCCIATSHLEIA